MNRNTAFLVFVGICVAVGSVVWIRYDFGPQWAAMVALVLLIIAVGFVEWLKTLATMRATMNTIVDLQQADDRGEVARSRMLTEVVRNAGLIEHEQQRQAHWWERMAQKQLPAPTQAQIPMWDDADTVDGNVRDYVIAE